MNHMPIRNRMAKKWTLLLTVITLMALEGCMSDSRHEEKNQPLPRMSKADAEDWARRFTLHLAETVGVPLNKRKPVAKFFPCTGRNGETATDARYTLMYTAWLDLPPEKHNEAAVKLRKMFETDGYSISTFRPYRDQKETMIVEARPQKGGFFIGIESANEGRRELSLGINSPCMIPPSEPQKEQ